MSKFHLDKHGMPAVCSATVKACPLGGEHYASMKEAQQASVKAELADTLAVVKSAQQREEELDRAVQDAHTWGDDEFEAFTEDLRNERKAWEAGFDTWVDEYGDAFDDPYWDDFEDPFADVVLDDEHYDNEVTPAWSDEDEANGIVYAGLSDDPVEQDEFALTKLRASIEDNLEFFNSCSPELAMLALDRTASDEAVKTLDNRQGRRALHELVKVLEARIVEDKARAKQDGTYVAMDFVEQESVVSSMRHMLNPRSGRRGSGRNEQRPIDPELIQALRCMYLKKFGVDPFESGVSVSDLLAMLKAGQLR